MQHLQSSGFWPALRIHFPIQCALFSARDCRNARRTRGVAFEEDAVVVCANARIANTLSYERVQHTQLSSHVSFIFHRLFTVRYRSVFIAVLDVDDGEDVSQRLLHVHHGLFPIIKPRKRLPRTKHE